LGASLLDLLLNRGVPILLGFGHFVHLSLDGGLDEIDCELEEIESIFWWWLHLGGLAETDDEITAGLVGSFV
jgi:hypothetical protein